uniref:LRAT domain-containing protein n=1 Tax=Acrobeloides nanus TaxID=290746 RepID=A0A914C572_9BILA
MSQSYRRVTQNTVNRVVEVENEDFDSVESPLQKFEAWVNIDIPSRSEKFFGQTEKDQWFCFVLTTFMDRFEVRLYMDEDHKEDQDYVHWYQLNEEPHYIESRRFVSRDDAILYIKKRKNDLKENLCKEKYLTRIRLMPKDCVKNPDKYLKPGDHIQTPLPIVDIAHHEGIYLGDGKVIHISVDKLSLKHAVREKGKACARIGRLYPNFTDSLDKDIKVVVYRIRFRTPDEIINCAYEFAKEFYREGEYHLLLKNCQHFASLCAAGREEMTDKTNLIATGSAAIGVMGAIGMGLYAGYKIATIVFSTTSSTNEDDD